jgi:hypothetical protein
MNRRRNLALAGAVLGALALVCGFPSNLLAADKCPTLSTISAITSTDAEFKAAGPLALATIKSAKAMVKEGGSRLSVYLSNGVFTAAQMDNDMVLPIKKKGEAVVILKFMNGPTKIAAGAYKPTSGWGNPLFVSADVMVLGTKPAGTVITFVAGGSSDKGTATIVEMTATQVCGTFDITGGLGRVAGSFVATIEK